MPLTNPGIEQTEGIWTPSFTGSIQPGNHTYAPSERHGWFVKIGKQVFIDFTATITAKDAAVNGDVFLTGLPFPVKTPSPYVCSAALGGLTGFIFPSGYSQLLMHGVRGTSQLIIRFYGSNVAPTTCTHIHLGAGSINLRGSMTYLID